MKYASATDVGLVRQENEDYLIAKAPIFILADGMGGHKAGDVASKIAAQTAFKVASAATGEDKLAVLKKAVEAANKKVVEKSLQVKAQNGMGSTLTMVLIEGLRAHIANIGDSRTYLLRGGKFRQITEDHSLVAQMVKEGKITDKEARKHPYRNVITRAVGSEPNIHVDLFSHELLPADRLLLASDGLTGVLKDSQIKKIIVENGELNQACEQLIKAANAKGGPDNISVILVEIEKGGPVQKKKTPKYKFLGAVLGLVALTTLLLAGVYLNKNSYYLGANKRKVALYRGWPYQVLGFNLSKVKYTSDVAIEKLDPAMKRRLRRSINVKSQKDGLEAIRDMEEEELN